MSHVVAKVLCLLDAFPSVLMLCIECHEEHLNLYKIDVLSEMRMIFTF